MDGGGPAAARDFGLADQRDAVGLQAAHERVQPVDVDREVAKPLAPPREDARRGARRDEGGLVAVPVVAAVDDAQAGALEGRGVGAEPALLDVDREMMHALAAAGEEALDEARRARALDQLELPVADEEVGPDELVIVAGARLDAHADGEHTAEEGERGGEGPDRDRDVVDAESGKGR